MGRLTQQLQGGDGRLSTQQAQVSIPQETGFLGGIAEDIKKRTAKVEQISDIYKEKGISLPEGALQVAGQAAGGVLDVAGRAISKITPDIIEKPIVKGISSIVQTAPVQEIVKTYQEFQTKHPRAAADLEASINLLMVLGLPKAQKTGQAIVGKGSKTITAAGTKSLQIEKESFVRRLTRPIRTPTVQRAEVARTTEAGFGPLKKSIVAPTSKELAAQKAVLQVQGVDKLKTYQQNYNIIKTHNKNLAQTLETQLKANDFTYSKKELASLLKNTKKELTRSPLLVGDNAKLADKLITELTRRLNSAQPNGSSLLGVRKEFDIWVKKQKPHIFDPKSDNALSFVNRELRGTVNDFLEKKATNVAVKQSLQKQNALFTAMENIAPKAAQEADTAIGRAFQNMMLTVGIKNRLVQQVAAIVGIGGLGAAATFAPTFAVLGVGGYTIMRAGRLVLSPKLRIYVGRLLEEYGRVAGPQAVIQTKKAIEQALNEANQNLVE
ncbi:MAG: hypothetical protein A2W47_04495 [Gammaproteobacteria bacterium RIFCSPHIGHO2_12_38_15]|nr:MAG: hypothetical protein A2W47_04495 [Gammaproteobacteria bacterium RIFCSPHIGHO2_12_38_15]